MSQNDSDDVRSTAQLLLTNARHSGVPMIPYDMCEYANQIVVINALHKIY